MSGRKQHFIPQSLLKGFGFEKGKRTYVVAYTRDRGIFTPATDGIGAERNFYSELSVNGEDETLDDRITDYEQPFTDILPTLRGAPDGGLVDTRMAAAFVTHLAVRNDHFRKAVTAGGTNLLESMADALNDTEQARLMLGMAGDQPSEIFAAELAKLWTRQEPLLAALGMSRAQFESWAFQLAKENFTTFHAELSGPLAGLFDAMIAKLPEVAASSQRQSLTTDLSPPARVEKMSRFGWRVWHWPTPLLLPDCVAVAFDAKGQTFPLMFADLDSVDTIAMPLSSDRLLVGGNDMPAGSPNPAFARCSWDFFVARERTAPLEEMRGLLRTRISEFLDQTVLDVLAEQMPESTPP